MRRNSLRWRRRHPGKSKWTTVPLFPGTHIYQDLYIAHTKPADNGYPELVPDYALFPSRAKAVRGCPEDTLMLFHHRAPILAKLQDQYGDLYTFHTLVRLPSTPYQKRHRQ